MSIMLTEFKIYLSLKSLGWLIFLNGVGGDKPQKDERTIYAPIDGQDYAYPEGFPTLKKTDLVDINGEVNWQIN